MKLIKIFFFLLIPFLGFSQMEGSGLPKDDKEIKLFTQTDFEVNRYVQTPAGIPDSVILQDGSFYLVLGENDQFNCNSLDSCDVLVSSTIDSLSNFDDYQITYNSDGTNDTLFFGAILKIDIRRDTFNAGKLNIVCDSLFVDGNFQSVQCDTSEVFELPDGMMTSSTVDSTNTFAEYQVLYNSDGTTDTLFFDTILSIDIRRDTFNVGNSNIVCDSLFVNNVFQSVQCDTVSKPFNLDDIVENDECVGANDLIIVKTSTGEEFRPYKNFGNLGEITLAAGATYLVGDSVSTVIASGGETNVQLPFPCDGCSDVTVTKDPCAESNINIETSDGSLIDGVSLSENIPSDKGGSKTFRCNSFGWGCVSSILKEVSVSYTIPVCAATTQNIRIKQLSGDDFTIDWGDGSVITYPDNTSAVHSYATAYTGDVIVTSACALSIDELGFAPNSFVCDDIANLPSGLTYYSNAGQNTTTGDIANLPVGLTYYRNQGQNTTTGDIANLPVGLTYYDNTGQNTTTGDIANLPSGLTYYSNAGQNTTTGDIANLPVGLTFYANVGQNTTTGDIANLPSGLTYYSNAGQNTTTGDIANLPSGLTLYANTGQNTTTGDIANLPVGLTYYRNQGQNTTTGDIANLPVGLTYYDNTGQNTTTGDIANLPVGLTYYRNQGQNTTTGDIANLPVGLTYYDNTGQNTTTGDIANLPVGLTFYYNDGQNTVCSNSGYALQNSYNTFRSVTFGCGMSATEVDNLLIAASAVSWVGSKSITITGGNAAPTAASSAAIASLVAAGVTVTTN